MSDFWAHAALVKTKRRYDPGCKLRRAVYDLRFGRGAFRGYRLYRDEQTGEEREEIALYFKK